MLRIELASRARVEPRHFELANNKAVLVNSIDDLASGGISIRLDESEGPLLLAFKLLTCVKVSVLNEFELARVDSDNGAEEELVWSGVSSGHSL